MIYSLKKNCFCRNNWTITSDPQLHFERFIVLIHICIYTTHIFLFIIWTVFKRINSVGSKRVMARVMYVRVMVSCVVTPDDLYDLKRLPDFTRAGKCISGLPQMLIARHYHTDCYRSRWVTRAMIIVVIVQFRNG